MNRRKFLAGSAALAVSAIGWAEDPTEKYEAGGLSFTAPKAWKSSKPSSPMRILQFKIDPAGKDEDPAELVITSIRGGGGSIEQNVARWKSQFQGKDGEAPGADTKTVKAKNVEVTTVEISGRYVAPVFPGRPEKYDKPDWRLLGAIVPAEGTGYYFKLVGPEATVKAAKPAFEALVKSISVGSA